MYITHTQGYTGDRLMDTINQTDEAVCHNRYTHRVRQVRLMDTIDLTYEFVITATPKPEDRAFTMLPHGL